MTAPVRIISPSILPDTNGSDPQSKPPQRYVPQASSRFTSSDTSTLFQHSSLKTASGSLLANTPNKWFANGNDWFSNRRPQMRILDPLLDEEGNPLTRPMLSARSVAGRFEEQVQAHLSRLAVREDPLTRNLIFFDSEGRLPEALSQAVTSCVPSPEDAKSTGLAIESDRASPTPATTTSSLTEGSSSVGIAANEGYAPGTDTKSLLEKMSSANDAAEQAYVRDLTGEQLRNYLRDLIHHRVRALRLRLAHMHDPKEIKREIERAQQLLCDEVDDINLRGNRHEELTTSLRDSTVTNLQSHDPTINPFAALTQQTQYFEHITDSNSPYLQTVHFVLDLLKGNTKFPELVDRLGIVKDAREEAAQRILTAMRDGKLETDEDATKLLEELGINIQDHMRLVAQNNYARRTIADMFRNRDEYGNYKALSTYSEGDALSGSISFTDEGGNPLTKLKRMEAFLLAARQAGHTNISVSVNPIKDHAYTAPPADPKQTYSQSITTALLLGFFVPDYKQEFNDGRGNSLRIFSDYLDRIRQFGEQLHEEEQAVARLIEQSSEPLENELKDAQEAIKSGRQIPTEQRQRIQEALEQLNELKLRVDHFCGSVAGDGIEVEGKFMLSRRIDLYQSYRAKLKSCAEQYKALYEAAIAQIDKFKEKAPKTLSDKRCMAGFIKDTDALLNAMLTGGVPVEEQEGVPTGMNPLRQYGKSLDSLDLTQDSFRQAKLNGLDNENARTVALVSQALHRMTMAQVVQLTDKSNRDALFAQETALASEVCACLEPLITQLARVDSNPLHDVSANKHVRKTAAKEIAAVLAQALGEGERFRAETQTYDDTSVKNYSSKWKENALTIIREKVEATLRKTVEPELLERARTAVVRRLRLNLEKALTLPLTKVPSAPIEGQPEQEPPATITTRKKYKHIITTQKEYVRKEVVDRLLGDLREENDNDNTAPTEQRIKEKVAEQVELELEALHEAREQVTARITQELTDEYRVSTPSMGEDELKHRVKDALVSRKVRARILRETIDALVERELADPAKAPHIQRLITRQLSQVQATEETVTATTDDIMRTVKSELGTAVKAMRKAYNNEESEEAIATPTLGSRGGSASAA